MKILINEIWEKIHLTCLLLSGQGGSGKGQGGQEVTSPLDEVSSLYIRNSFKTAICFMSSHKPREDLRASLSILVHSKHIIALRDESSEVKVQLKVRGARITDIEYKLEKLEREKKRTTPIIDRVNEVDGEITSMIVDRSLADLQVGFTSADCTAVFHRRKGKKEVGDYKEGARVDENNLRVRSILVILPSPNETAAIFRNLKNLKEEWKGVFFNDDLTEHQANEHRDLCMLVAGGLC